MRNDYFYDWLEVGRFYVASRRVSSISALLRLFERFPRNSGFISANAVAGVVIDQAHRLHEGEHGCGANKLPSAFFKIF